MKARMIEIPVTKMEQIIKTLSMEEEQIIKTLVGSVLGDTKGPRAISDPIYDQLSALGIDEYDCIVMDGITLVARTQRNSR